MLDDDIRRMLSSATTTPPLVSSALGGKRSASPHVSLNHRSEVFRVVSAAHAVLTDPAPHKRGSVLAADGKRGPTAGVTLR
jgi:hypothetical protein